MSNARRTVYNKDPDKALIDAMFNEAFDKRMERGAMPSFRAGAQRSVNRLEFLKFDPIGELVDTYDSICKEIIRMELIRDGAIIESRLDGKPRAYSREVHMALIDRRIAIAKELLRYGYGRAPEGDVKEAPKEKPMLVVQLT